jgi:hypothetical protein
MSETEFDTSVAHIARVYDCWLGGTNNCTMWGGVGRLA